MKLLNGYEEKTDTKICINYIKRFIVGIFIVLFYILFVAIINITLPFEIAVIFIDILSIIAGLILAVLFGIAVTFIDILSIIAVLILVVLFKII